MYWVGGLLIDSEQLPRAMHKGVTGFGFDDPTFRWA